MKKTTLVEEILRIKKIMSESYDDYKMSVPRAKSIQKISKELSGNYGWGGSGVGFTAKYDEREKNKLEKKFKREETTKKKRFEKYQQYIPILDKLLNNDLFLRKTIIETPQDENILVSEYYYNYRSVVLVYEYIKTPSGDIIEKIPPIISPYIFQELRNKTNLGEFVLKTALSIYFDTPSIERREPYIDLKKLLEK